MDTTSQSSSTGAGSEQLALLDAGEPSLPDRVVNGGAVPEYGDVVLTPEDLVAAAERWPDASPAKQRHWMKQSVLAKLRHQVVVDSTSGRRAFGGVQPGSGRKKAMGDSLVAVADSRLKEIMDAIFSALDPKLAPEIRHKAGINILREVRKDRELDLKEDELDRASREDLVREAAIIMAEMARNGEIDLSDPEAILDAQVVED